jgi:hypothetical protein
MLLVCTVKFALAASIRGVLRLRGSAARGGVDHSKHQTEQAAAGSLGHLGNAAAPGGLLMLGALGLLQRSQLLRATF